MGFQKGDFYIVIEQQAYGLRLTMGALAEISSRLSAAGPQALAMRLRSLTPADGRVLLACVMRPCLPPEDTRRRSVATLSDAEISSLLPVICQLFEQAFSHER